MNQPSQTNHQISKPARRAKVSYARKRHQDPKTLRTRRYSQHPSLVLTGDWLEEAGFMTGMGVCISVQYGQLILQRLPVTENPQDAGQP
ncbi:type I toxin-antitoxin system SymE family toxin [Enterobacteriaceae bacterium 89]|nr:type I toxin-antitoxin system SymE family toxin [Enterobacteriaceae bacterium 89]